MIIVSNKRVKGRNEQHMSYDEFKEKAFSEEGLDINDTLIINIHDMQLDEYNAAAESDSIQFFSLTGTCPNWCNVNKIQDWSAYSEGNATSQKIEQKATSQPSESEKPKTSIEIPDMNFGEFNKSEQNQVDQNEGPQQRVLNADTEQEITYLLDDANNGDSENSGAKVFVFGSSKGGTGKTFTAIMSTYRYAKTHPHQKIALVDFDIIDGQVGISIHKVKPTIRKYLAEYQKGYDDFRTMHEFCVHAKDPFPQNVDFYLAPSNNARINDDNFWLNVIKNCIENYDVVVFDTGIDYINLRPISYVYKCADKILLVTTTSIKSVNSVTKQIGRLKGEIDSKDQNGRNVFSQDDGIAPHLNIIITQMLPSNEMNKTIYNSLASKANVVATFGVITDSVSRAEFFGEWNVFDRNSGVNKAFDDIMS